MNIKVELCTYNGWTDCVRIANDKVEVIAATKVGPRILRYAFLGEDNIFYEAKEQMGLVGGEDFRIYGGHRLWHGPQVDMRPNEPDNEEILYELLEDGVVLTGKKEAKAGMRKSITIRLSQDDTKVIVLHSITNLTVWPVELTAWALSVMAGGGTAIWPNSRLDTKFLPNGVLVTWPYTNINDVRFSTKKNYMSLKQDKNIEEWFKAGSNNTEGWAAYRLNKTLFIKQYEHILKATYSDFGSSFEVYTDKDILELESLSPLTRIEQGETVHHKEIWNLVHFEDTENLSGKQNELEEKMYHYVTSLVKS